MKRVIICAIAVLGLGACAKQKINSQLNPSGNEVATNSSIRLFNFYNYNLDVTINNIPLTSYGEPLTEGTAQGLALFPAGSWQTEDNGNPFFVPNSLVAKDRTVHIKSSSQPFFIDPQVSNQTFTASAIDTILVDDPLNPKDYYALATGHLLVIPRNTEAPTQPMNVKIRVINLGAPNEPNNEYGPVTLTYSDGSPVDPALSNVAPGAISPYVEIPYAAIMFKLFISGDYTRQFAEQPMIPNLNVCTVPTPVPCEGLWPKVRTYGPGSTYSFVITQNVGIFQPCTYVSPPTIAAFNGYRVVTEQSGGTNVTFARMDAFNALPTAPVTITVDGQPLGSNVPYGTPTDYGIYVQGTHQVQALNAQGQVLVTKSFTLAAFDNWTAWVYQNPSGQADICFSNTDMTSTLYQTDANGDIYSQTNSNPPAPPPPDDGTNGSIRVAVTPYAWQTRFLNLTPDVPYVTFTDNGSTFPNVATYGGGASGSATVGPGDSTSYPDASVNMAPGYTPDYDPFIMCEYQTTYGNLGQPGGGFLQSPLAYPPINIRVFQSGVGAEGAIPGSLLAGIKALPGTAYISNPALYPTAGFMPQAEPGIYTTALIGRAFTATSTSDAARLVILKHNK